MCKESNNNVNESKEYKGLNHSELEAFNRKAAA